MWTPTIVLELLLVWAISFLIALLPAIWLSQWIVRTLSSPYHGFAACVAYTKLFVLLAALFLLLARFESLPHVNSDRPGFVIFFTAVVFGVPVFFAFLVGLRRARRINFSRM